MEDACGDVLLGQVACHEVLYVCLGKYPTACSHGVDVGGLHSQFAHALVVHAHEHTHLVDKGSRTTGAVAVHSQFHAPIVLEEYDLGILPSNVDECLGLRMCMAGIDACRYHFLYKLRLQLFGGGHPHASRNADVCWCITCQFVNFLEIARHKFAYTGVVSLVF